MVVLVICKNDGDPYKNEGTRMLTTFLPFKDNGDFSRRSKAANSAVLCWILLNRDFLVVLVTCKDKEDPIKNGGARMLTRFPHYNAMGAICCRVLIQSSSKL